MPNSIRAVFAVLLLTILMSLSITITSADVLEQPTYAGTLETYLRNQMDVYHIPGIAVAIVRDSEIDYLGGVGIANEDGAPVTPQTPFLLASVSKAMTAVAILQLAEDGRIQLEDSVQTYLPDFSPAGQAGEEITVADLLYHTSGFSELGGLEANLRADSPDALAALVDGLTRADLQFAPGSSWEYSNLNYSVLGRIIEVVSGQSYEDYIASHIFVPLGMENSFASMDAARAAGASSGYYPFFGQPIVFDEQMPYTRATVPAAGLWTSAEDMSRYLLALLDAGQAGDARLLSQDSLQRLFGPGYSFDETQGYAMGWTVNRGFMLQEDVDRAGAIIPESESLTVVFHEGDWVNYKSVAFLIPELEYGIALLMNSNDPMATSALRFFAWDVTLIAMGGQPEYFPPAESFLLRNARVALAVTAVLLATALIWLWRIGRIHGAARGLATATLAAAVLLNAYIFLKFLPDNNASLPLALRFAPDTGLLIALIVLLSLFLVAVSVRVLVEGRPISR
ncbi:MAG: class A beta-lactamase-related serine hydrolase [Anaerolineae bacterium]|nr:MAG: class A beta-lactamase-related serine hydrolase [Anaerolineae bacterium]